MVRNNNLLNTELITAACKKVDMLVFYYWTFSFESNNLIFGAMVTGYVVDDLRKFKGASSIQNLGKTILINLSEVKGLSTPQPMSFV